MSIIAALICILAGGVINGSFALPTVGIRQWVFENVWINYAVWAFIVLPWISIFTLAPSVWNVYLHIPNPSLWFLIIGGGILFGIGQMCFAQSLKMIGMGLSFVLNIGLGTGLGFLMPLVIMHPEKILTPFGYTTLTSIGLIFAGLLVSFFAGRQRDLHKRRTQVSTPAGEYHIGVLLAVIAGVCSAVQNFTFAATAQLQTFALHQGLKHLAAAMILWPMFLTFSFIPYIIYMLYLHYKNRSFVHYQNAPNGLNCFLAFVMALCWWCPLVLYSQASLWIGGLGPVVGWPLFMVMIILASNFWGWRHREWEHVSRGIKNQALSAIGILVLAVIILAYSATLT